MRNVIVLTPAMHEGRVDNSATHVIREREGKLISQGFVGGSVGDMLARFTGRFGYRVIVPFPETSSYILERVR